MPAILDSINRFSTAWARPDGRDPLAVHAGGARGHARGPAPAARVAPGAILAVADRDDQAPADALLGPGRPLAVCRAAKPSAGRAGLLPPPVFAAFDSMLPARLRCRSRRSRRPSRRRLLQRPAGLPLVSWSTWLFLAWAGVVSVADCIDCAATLWAGASAAADRPRPPTTWWSGLALWPGGSACGARPAWCWWTIPVCCSSADSRAEAGPAANLAAVASPGGHGAGHPARVGPLAARRSVLRWRSDKLPGRCSDKLPHRLTAGGVAGAWAAVFGRRGC